MFNRANNFVITNSQFFDNSVHSNNNGLQLLLNASLPEATHDSSARWPPPQCFPGTRDQYIRDFTTWILDEHRTSRITWMSGPAGVGKSALAQTCAETIGPDFLAATFFFSRLKPRDDPARLFTTIAYQIAMACKPFAAILDEKISHNPSLLSKSIEVQFRELILGPYAELGVQTASLRDRLVIIDGLDECNDDMAQCTIIELVAKAVQAHGDKLPLLWAFFSRPEPHLSRTFSSNSVSSLCSMTTLSVSREIDGEIELYVRGGFENIRKRHACISLSLAAAWPSDDAIATLVAMSAGLFIYAATALKFIGDPDALDPEEQLQIVLSLRPGDPPLSSSVHQNPIAELDALYTLIMQRIPSRILPFTQRILLLFSEAPCGGTIRADIAPVLTNIIGLNFASFETALAKLHSVLTVEKLPESYQQAPANRIPWMIHFHHASFLEFLVDLSRCGETFWIRHPQHYENLAKTGMEALTRVSSAPGRSLAHKISATTLPAPLEHLEKTTASQVRYMVYRHISEKIFDWLVSASANAPERSEFYDKLLCFNWRAFWSTIAPKSLSRGTLESLISKVPVEHRKRIIRRYKPRVTSSRGYVLGKGERRVRLEFDSHGQISVNLTNQGP